MRLPVERLAGSACDSDMEALNCGQESKRNELTVGHAHLSKVRKVEKPFRYCLRVAVLMRRWKKLTRSNTIFVI